MTSKDVHSPPRLLMMYFLRWHQKMLVTTGGAWLLLTTVLTSRFLFRTHGLFYICTIIFLCISRSLCLYSRLYRTFVCSNTNIWDFFIYAFKVHTQQFSYYIWTFIFTIELFVFLQLYNHRSSLGAATMWLCGAVTACMKKTNQVSLITLF